MVSFWPLKMSTFFFPSLSSVFFSLSSNFFFLSTTPTHDISPLKVLAFQVPTSKSGHPPGLENCLTITIAPAITSPIAAVGLKVCGQSPTLACFVVTARTCLTFLERRKSELYHTVRGGIIRCSYNISLHDKWVNVDHNLKKYSEEHR